MTDLTACAIAGYYGNLNPHLYSSAAYYAHKVGAYAHSVGFAPPTKVRMGRGYQIHCNGMLFRMMDEGRSTSFQRIK